MPGRLERLWRRLTSPPKRELTLPQPTLTLSFDYERGLAGDDPRLADAGLEAVLEMLSRHAVRATFNCCAALAESAPQRLLAVIAAGHEVACHAHQHESPRDLDDVALECMLARCVDAMTTIGIRPMGFRSPQSHWDDRLMNRLPAHGFAYSAERDAAKRPYRLQTSPRLWRMPIVTDDWGYVRRPAEPQRVAARHMDLVMRLASHDRPARFAAIGFHPWLLAADTTRIEACRRLLDAAVAVGIRVCCFADVLAAAAAE